MMGLMDAGLLTQAQLGFGLGTLTAGGELSLKAQEFSTKVVRGDGTTYSTRFRQIQSTQLSVFLNVLEVRASSQRHVSS